MRPYADAEADLLIDSVKQLIGDHVGEAGATLDVIAKDLDVHPKTLTRRLTLNGVTFGQLKDDVRFAIAKRYIATGMAFEDISWRLGFKDPSGFYRAFKKWSGRAPTRYRAYR